MYSDLKMCICNIYKKIAFPSEFIWTVRLILEPAAFKKDAKAVTLIRESGCAVRCGS